MEAALDVSMLGLKRQLKQEPDAQSKQRRQDKADRGGKGKGGGGAAALASDASTAAHAPAVPTPFSSARAAAGSNRNRAEEDLVTMVARLTLRHGRQLATLNAILLRVVLFNKDTGTVGEKFFDKIKDVLTDYTAHVQQLPTAARSEYSPPHTFIWLESLNIVAADLQGAEDQWAVQAVNSIQAHLADIKEKAKTQLESLDPEKHPEVYSRIIAGMVMVCSVRGCRGRARPSSTSWTTPRRSQQCWLSSITSRRSAAELSRTDQHHARTSSAK
eukprot:TRINITY_DN63004_c0_g1_i1.p1 TRINITY_DN63004_c0_g1~~TRINITY_DN63004_c0_g1_i1.p1  ORF type:complete len:283 (+),score=61.15 TRINITY_DN63004_c0_g1_i1:31-849(+)